MRCCQGMGNATVSFFAISVSHDVMMPMSAVTLFLSEFLVV